MKKNCLLCLLLPVVFAIGCSSDDGSQSGSDSKTQAGSQVKSTTVAGKITVANMAKWQFLGIGDVSVDDTENAVRLSEGEDSKGVTIVSPKSYGTNVTVSFKVKPLTYESVNVVILSASDSETGGDIKIPADYDGNWGFWTEGNVSNYIFAFHNAAHDRPPFIVKSPGMTVIAEAPENVAGERWHDVEIARHGSHLIMKIDGTTVVQGTDSGSGELPGGKVCFRMRGTPGNPAAALFKDIVINEH